MKNIWRTLGSAAALASLATPAAAGTIICEVNLGGRLAINRGGGLSVDIGSGILTICSMSETDRGMTKEACASWFSALLTLKMAKARARLYFDLTDPNNTGVTSCSNLGDWVVRTPYFLENY